MDIPSSAHHPHLPLTLLSGPHLSPLAIHALPSPPLVIHTLPLNCPHLLRPYPFILSSQHPSPWRPPTVKHTFPDSPRSPPHFAPIRTPQDEVALPREGVHSPRTVLRWGLLMELDLELISLPRIESSRKLLPLPQSQTGIASPARLCLLLALCSIGSFSFYFQNVSS